MNWSRIILFVAASLLSVTSAHATGAINSAMSVRALGMGNAWSAIADSPAAAWYNPAATAFTEGWGLTIGAHLVRPSSKFDNGVATYHARAKWFAVPNVYISWSPESSPLAFSLAANSPFGLESDWSNSNAPFTLPTAGAASLSYSQLYMFSLSPAVAWRINRNWAIAIGARYDRMTELSSGSDLVSTEGSGDGWGGHASIAYQGDRLRFAMIYRSRVKVDIKGSATSGILLAVPPALGGLGIPPGQVTGMSSAYHFPDLVTVSAAWRLTPRLWVALEAYWAGRSKIKRADARFSPSFIGAFPLASASSLLNWKDTITWQTGISYDASDKVKLRLGFGFDPKTTDDVDFSPRYNDADKLSFTAGIGFKTMLNSDLVLGIDAVYNYVHFIRRNINGVVLPFNGSYRSNANLAGIEFTLRQ